MRDFYDQQEENRGQVGQDGSAGNQKHQRPAWDYRPRRP